MRVVLCNTPPDDAERLATALVERRLAACVNVIRGVISIYRWKGAIEREAESTLLIKTRASHLPALMDAIRELHPYEVPEIVALPVEPSEVNPAYLQWLREETEPPPG
jgi:periplasmic divalent cation tolerance protein